MKYSATHTFQVNADRFIQLYFDDAYNLFLDKKLHIRKRKLLNQREDEKMVLREHLIIPERKIPKVLRVLVDNREISYTEKRILYKDRNELAFTITPGIFKGRIICRGKFKIKPSGKNSIIRQAEGELVVKIPVVGKLAEKFIIKEIMKSITQSKKLAEEYFKKHPPSLS